MLLALRNLTRDRTRLALSVTGVALAVMLILLLGGYRAGIYAQTSAYLDHVQGDIVVAERGVNDFLGTNSVLPPSAEAAVAATPGVARVVPVVAQSVVFELHGRKELAYFVGYEAAAGGGPWDLVAGREPEAQGEIVLDRVMADEHRVRVGDSVAVLDQNLTVVGLSGGTALWLGSFVFADPPTIQSLVRAPGALSFLFVTPAPGTAAADLRARIHVAGTDALLKSEVIAADRTLFGRVYDAAIGLMTAIAFFVGVLVVALIVYTATIERRREYGAFKAIGARNGILYRVVAYQAITAGAAGAVAGTALAYGVAALLVAWRPQFPVSIEPPAILVAIGASVAMAILAALVPARSIARLAPAEVFR